MYTTCYSDVMKQEPQPLAMKESSIGSIQVPTVATKVAPLVGFFTVFLFFFCLSFSMSPCISAASQLARAQHITHNHMQHLYLMLHAL